MSSTDRDRDADYVVVGGGASGCVVAARLAEDLPDSSVCLIEAGPSDEGQERIGDARRWAALLESDLDYNYAVAPQRRGNDRIRIARARVLGGCTSHNNCIAFRPPTYDMEMWEQQGAEGWGPETVHRYSDRVEQRVHLEQIATDNQLAAAFIEAAGNAGYPRIDLGRQDVDEGAGWFAVSMNGHRRESSSEAYLRGAPANLEVLTDTVATKLPADRGRVFGVQTSRGFVRANREVIVSCGAIDTPKLLMLSGIGPASHLREFGVTVVADRQGVGENLRDHPEGIIVWESTRPVPSDFMNLEAALFVKLDPGAPAPDLMFHFLTMKFDSHPTSRGYPTAEHVFSAHPNVPRSRSVGTVRLQSADPAEPPMIDPCYFTDAEKYDEGVLVSGIRIARDLARTAPLSDWVARELAPGAEVVTSSELSEFVRLTSNTGYHVAGTCKMGAKSDRLSVVDPALRVIGVEGLRVADASIFPTMVGVNIALTCMMIGERAADLIASDAK